MSRPPADHGSDRYGYVEYSGAPEGVKPPDTLVNKAIVDACQDCNPNLFFRWVRPHVWALTIAHDDSCPTLARIEQERRR